MKSRMTMVLAVAMLALSGTSAQAKKYCGSVARGKVTAYDVTTGGPNCPFAREAVARFVKKSRRTHQNREFRHNHMTLNCSWEKHLCYYHQGGGRRTRTIRWTWEVPYSSSLASWYDDSGNTASGSHYTYGVAHKEYAFGTQVEICLRGCVVATVDDRGPYIEPREWDLNQNVRAAIGFDGVQTVRWRLVR